MVDKAVLEKQIQELKTQLAGVQADCGILLLENTTLIDALFKINPNHPILSNLFSMQWRDANYSKSDLEEFSIKKEGKENANID